MDKSQKIIITVIVAALFFTIGTAFQSYFSHADAPPDEEVTSENGDKNEDKEKDTKEEDKKEDKDKKLEEKEEEEKEEKPAHGLEFSYPDAVRGIYLTGHSAGGQRFDDLVELVDNSDLNSMVIDIKDDTGNITFKLEDTPYDDYSRNYIGDPEEVLKTLEEHDIYPIARIVVFKDNVFTADNPDLALRNPDGSLWTNRRGESYANAFKEEVWEYNLEIAKKAAEMGFQDIQFDYVRFPEGFENREDELDYSFGNYTEEELMPKILDEWEEEIQETEEKMEQAEQQIEEDVEDDSDEKENSNEENNDNNDSDNEEENDEPEPPEYSYGLARTQAITDFVAYAYDELSEYDVDVSVDIFGYTAVDMDAHGIGQNFLDISRNVDVISSMIYPSHWGPGYFGISTPDTEPYRLTEEYIIRENKILGQLEDPPVSRPWIQDFTATWLGSGNYISYGKEEVEAQIRALNEHGVDEFLLWDSNNNYTRDVDYTPLED
ncbi:putative glycoside hydrolase [Natranaerofaba carboxydovora]|uniref:putative glycoside hydrolase n=1 Tax=Natranaerofaba carboxydovora TaxID=2742683 RepID=UPI001F13A286|nr:putative glycoside hydrolase [Natranaerofaba carboxydovora]UMZ74482.1 Putative glycosyl hydrolase domain protein [Natranaerofaba carboxydovora]